MTTFIYCFVIFVSAASNLFADQFDTATFAYSPEYNYKNPKFEKKNNLHYINLDYLTLAYEKWDTLNSKSNIVVRKVLFNNMESEILLTNNNFLNTNPAVSHTMIIWVSNINSNLDLFFSNYNGTGWSLPQALLETPQYEFTPDLTEYKNLTTNPAYYIVYQMGGDIYLKILYEGNFLLDTNLTININEGCTSPKIRIYRDKIFIAYLKSVNSVQRIVITKANIGSDYRLNNITTAEIIQLKSASGINFSNGFSSFPSEGGFINYNYDTLGTIHTLGINLGNYSDKNIFTENNTGKNTNGTGSVIEIVTDNVSSNYYFTVFGWLRKSNDSATIIAKGNYNYSSSGITKSFYLGDSTVNLNFDVSNYFPNGSINSYRFRLVWERKINNRSSLVESRFDDYLSEINSHNNTIDDFILEQNYPNPFNPVTVINYSIAENGFVSLKIYNSLGNEIAIVVNQKQNAGRYTVDWRAENFPSGVYYYQLEKEGIKLSRKMVVLK